MSATKIDKFGKINDSGEGFDVNSEGLHKFFSAFTLYLSLIVDKYKDDMNYDLVYFNMIHDELKLTLHEDYATSPSFTSNCNVNLFFALSMLKLTSPILKEMKILDFFGNFSEMDKPLSKKTLANIDEFVEHLFNEYLKDAQLINDITTAHNDLVDLKNITVDSISNSLDILEKAVKMMSVIRGNDKHNLLTLVNLLRKHYAKLEDVFPFSY